MLLLHSPVQTIQSPLNVVAFVFFPKKDKVKLDTISQ